jgi:hypothetical protein
MESWLSSVLQILSRSLSAQSSSVLKRGWLFLLYGMGLYFIHVMQLMLHQHVYTSLKINFNAFYASWDNFMSLLLVINMWILVSVTINWSKLYCTLQGLNLTLLYSKAHCNLYFGHVDWEWNWKLGISHLHSIHLLVHKNTSDPDNDSTSQC